MRQKKFTVQAARRFIFLLLIVLCHILQFTLLPFFNIPFPIFLLIPLTVSISMNEHEFSGMFFGLVTGALWDLASPVTDGFLALFFAFFGCLCGLLSHYLLRNTVLTALILSAGIALTFSFINITFNFLSSGFGTLNGIFMKKYLPAVASAIILTVPSCFFIRKISLRFRSEKISEAIMR